MNIKIDGSIMEITSSLKVEEIKLLQRQNPKALTLFEKNEDGKSSPTFLLALGSSAGFGNLGVTFDDKTEDGFAHARIALEGGKTREEYQSYIKEDFGRGVLNLHALEEQAAVALAEVKERFEKAMELVEIL